MCALPRGQGTVWEGREAQNVMFYLLRLKISEYGYSILNLAEWFGLGSG